MKLPTILVCLWFLPNILLSQEVEVMPPIPAMRQIHHEYIIQSIKSIQSLPGAKDELFKKDLVWADQKITSIRIAIERNKQLENNDKYRWLRSTQEILTAFVSAFQMHQLPLNQLVPLVKAYDTAMKMELAKQNIYPIIEKNSLTIGNILVNNYGLQNNAGIEQAKDLLVWKYCQRYPNQILPELQKKPSNIFADTLIIQSAFHDAEKLYNYAAAPNDLGRKIQSVNHPLVKIIGQLSLTKTGRMYFPFLDQLYHQKYGLDSITPLLTDEAAPRYFQLLVATRIEYAGRMQKGDTPMQSQSLTAKLRAKAIELYINEINALHDLKDEKKRFQSLDYLSPQELYYLAVMGEAEMYTSSFVSGVYPRIFQRMRSPNSDSLLLSVHDDYFKKFIKIAAAYNTLDDFLQRMDSSSAKTRMDNFVDGLEKTTTLEDAVDVADSYASIYHPKIQQQILEQVQKNRMLHALNHHEKGLRIYKILEVLFLSYDTANHVNVSAELGIAPVYEMPLASLQDSAKRIVVQQFFYGDKDGANIFQSFLAGFNNGKWKIVQKPEWVELSAKQGTAITIFANKPLNEKLDLDVQAQQQLNQYLAQENLMPSIVIHRGHSYHLRSTIEQLSSSAKLVILGGCGGYQNLNDVLDICPTAQIISTKQVGTGVINKGLINEISETLRKGQNLNWPLLWNSMTKKLGVKYKGTFDDYVPPHKNLGAIFIMAYQQH